MVACGRQVGQLSGYLYDVGLYVMHFSFDQFVAKARFGRYTAVLRASQAIVYVVQWVTSHTKIDKNNYFLDQTSVSKPNFPNFALTMDSM